MNSPNPFHNKTLRSIHDPIIQGYWFSVTDLFAILTDSDHKTARGYWKRFKYRLSLISGQLVTVSHQLKWQAADGKFYFTEAVDFKTLIRLIQICPSPKANPYRLWLADMLFEGIPAGELEKELAKLGAESFKQVTEKYKNGVNKPYVRVVTEKQEVLL